VAAGRRADADGRRHHGRGGQTKDRGRRQSFLIETALRSDFALIHAFLADYLGNLTYALTARNFNPVMAMAANTVIVTAEHIVPVGVIAPDHVITPAPLVDYLIANG
jgi:acetate CoA/acetoacetate CoA-transferase alpha subunit